MSQGTRRPSLLLVGGGGGLVGRALLPLLTTRYQVVSLHRHPLETERRSGVEWLPHDVATVSDFRPWIPPGSAVILLAWYRWQRRSRFRSVADGLVRVVRDARSQGARRIVHLSVPPAPEALERSLPYLYEKRRVDRVLAASGLSYRIVRPTLLYGAGDRLLSVMMRLIHRYRRFPMFGDGEFGVSPVSAADLARIVVAELETPLGGTIDVGGPESWKYRDLVGLMFASLGLPPRYIHLTRRQALWVARLLRLGRSKLIYPYEIEWLMSGLLALPPYDGLGTPLSRVGPYIDAVASELSAQSVRRAHEG